MKILLVDDNRLVLRALKQKIDWEALGITGILTASNIAQAKEIFQTHGKEGPDAVSLMVCDIEMPQGSGLDLLSWLRREGYRVQAIFLTNYADFNYAQKAIELQSFDYFLKPIEPERLTEILKKAVDKIQAELEKEQALQKAAFSQEARLYAVRQFWDRMINGRVFPSQTEIARTIAELRLPYGREDLFLPVLINIYLENLPLTREDWAVFAYGMENVIQEIFESDCFSLESLCEIQQEHLWVAILKTSPDLSDETLLDNAVEHCCFRLIQDSRRYLNCEISCFLGELAAVDEVQQCISQTFQMKADYVGSFGQILSLNRYQPKDADYLPPDLNALERLLLDAGADAFADEAEKHLRLLSAQNRLTSAVMYQFQTDMTQIISAAARENGIRAHEIFPRQNRDPLFHQSLHSIENMKQYLAACAHRAVSQSTPQNQTDLIAQVKQYIHSHLDSDLSRGRLAEEFYLNPDYLARVFSRQENISLGNYIMQARVEEAKRLLRSTDQPVNAIAGRVGYLNYSHFSRIFREMCGCSPNEYRKTNR